MPERDKSTTKRRPNDERSWLVKAEHEACNAEKQQHQE